MEFGTHGVEELLFGGYDFVSKLLYCTQNDNRNVGVSQTTDSSTKVLLATRRKTYTVGPRFTNASVYEQFGLRTNFPSKKASGYERCLGLRTQSCNSGKLRVSARESVAPLPHHLPLTSSTLLRTGAVKLN
jgi:hypothetical protein